MRSVVEAIGAFWCIVIVSVLVIAGVVVGGQQAGFWLDSRNVQHQTQINKIQYQANQQSQMYQDTFLSQAAKTYQQVTIDKLNDDQAKASGDQTEINDAYAATAADIHIFCGDAQKLTEFTRAQFTPGEANLYQSAC